MDIKDILSPSAQEAPRSIASNPGSPKQSPFKYVQRTQSGPLYAGHLKQSSGASSLAQSLVSSNRLPAHLLSPAHQSTSSPLISPVPNSSVSPYLNRTTSTQSMDTLADLASMQNHQPTRSAPPLSRASLSYDGHGSPTFPSALATSLTSNPRASIDINMMEAPKQLARTDFSNSSLPGAQQNRLSELMAYVQESPSAYESHVEIIGILHEGLVKHIYPSSDPRSRRDPQVYDLINDLRRAREQMERLFAVGEDLWSDWLQDESLLAQTAEERIAVVEKCRQAVEEEAGSVKLWTTYCDWIHHCYTWAHSDGGQDSPPSEEKLIGKELFTWQVVIDTYQEAVSQTSRDLAQSHVVWNKYLEVRFPRFLEKLDPEQCSVVMGLFQDRLQIPHIQWDETFQIFSGFVSSNLEKQYEQIMMETNQLAARVKEAIAARESFEAALQQAQDASDRDAEHLAFRKYLDWELTPQKRRKPDVSMIDTLYQRAELRFPSDTSLWENHVIFLIERSMTDALPLLERATKHCPWFGSLWVHYMLTSERLTQSFQQTEEIKHKATSTGLLEAAGIEEVIAVHAAWCSYLRRRSARPDGSEEDIDVAEMGIRSCIESVSSLGVKLGLSEAPGTSFRLRRIYITFLTDSGRWDNARQEFDTSIQEYGKSYEFWLQFYHWEMTRWRKFAATRQRAGDESIGPPELATAVLKKALDQPNLDYPEAILQQYLIHCEDHVDAGELQQALFKARTIEQTVALRRQTEAAQATEASAAAMFNAQESDESALQTSKRKREEADDGQQHYKKSRSEEIAQVSVEAPADEQPKRDREHASILVQNLPDGITDVQIRRYFDNCGVVRSLKVLREDEISAVIEFEDDDAAKYALSRDGQEMEGSILSVTLDTGSTIYLTNYKPEADEAYMHTLLDKYGEILSIRFPSLQRNKNRRFCYVQFKVPSEAQGATELDGQKIDGLPLVCKISNPSVRKSREDKSHNNDGRTVFVGQLNFKTTEDEVKKLFQDCGSIESIRMPRDHTLKNRNKGIAFITFSNTGQANSALALQGHELHQRKIVVKIASNKNAGRSTSKATASPAPSSEAVASVVSDAPKQNDVGERQVFITNLSDTVNESRVKTFAGKYGTVARVILKTNHQGAILEYSTSAEAGEAALRLDGLEVESGRTIRVVTEQELKTVAPEKKADHLNAPKPKTEPPKAAPIGSTGPVRRPGQSGKKGGHLGQRSATIFKSATKTKPEETSGETKKSNDDFRNMLNGKQG